MYKRQGYEIVAGERRWRAARKAGVRNIPCIVRELSDEENMLLAIIENMQREDPVSYTHLDVYKRQDVKNAYERLGEIIGETVSDDIINEVFARFCLGK